MTQGSQATCSIASCPGSPRPCRLPTRGSCRPYRWSLVHQALRGPRTGREWLRLVGLDLSLDLLAGQGSRKPRAKAEGAGDLPGELCGQRLVSTEAGQ